MGDDRVLRRSRNQRSMVQEARTMEFVRSHGLRVPQVFDVSDDGFDLIMERIDGPTMLEVAGNQPWRIAALGRQLGTLHSTLHALAAPQWLQPAPFGEGENIIHLDLHPLNVLMSGDGPVLIDWTNAARGNPVADVALTWALIVAGEVPSNGIQARLMGIGRRILLRSFLKPFPATELRAMLADAVEYKCADANMSASEVRSMRALLLSET